MNDESVGGFMSNTRLVWSKDVLESTVQTEPTSTSATCVIRQCHCALAVSSSSCFVIPSKRQVAIRYEHISISRIPITRWNLSHFDGGYHIECCNKGILHFFS